MMRPTLMDRTECPIHCGWRLTSLLQQDNLPALGVGGAPSKLLRSDGFSAASRLPPPCILSKSPCISKFAGNSSPKNSERCFPDIQSCGSSPFAGATSELRTLAAADRRRHAPHQALRPHLYLTSGDSDLVIFVEAPSGDNVAKFALAVSSLGNVRTRTVRADLGHFGRRPIRTAWLWVVLPALTINYLGQGALVFGQTEVDSKSVFSALSRLGTAADGGSGNSSDSDRQPGCDYGRLFVNPTGNPTRSAAPLRSPPYLAVVGRPNIHAACECPLTCGRLAARHGISFVERIGFGVWHSRERRRCRF
jgi:hypothetical protein